jgi:CBS domain-containing protein
MVVFKVSGEMLALLHAAHLEARCVTHACGARTVAHGDVLSAVVSTGSDATLADLLRGAELHACHRAAADALAGPSVRDPALDARIARFRAQSEDAQYARMVRDVARGTSGLSNAEEESIRIGRFGAQASIGANVVVTMATCFAAGYFIFKHSSGSQAIGLIGGVVGMTGAMAVEATLVITRIYSIDAAAEKQKKKRIRRIPVVSPVMT